MSSPDIQTLINRACLINNEDRNTSVINPDDLEHPTKLIKFLVGVRYQNEYFALGGSWSPSLDGENPDNDSQVLIRTAIRCVHAQTGIDLSKCIQWYVLNQIKFEIFIYMYIIIYNEFFFFFVFVSHSIIAIIPRYL